MAFVNSCFTYNCPLWPQLVQYHFHTGISLRNHKVFLYCILMSHAKNNGRNDNHPQYGFIRNSSHGKQLLSANWGEKASVCTRSHKHQSQAKYIDTSVSFHTTHQHHLTYGWCPSKRIFLQDVTHAPKCLCLLLLIKVWLLTCRFLWFIEGTGHISTCTIKCRYYKFRII